jgi:riboflavin kinase/FMN adenylyltransferase
MQIIQNLDAVHLTRPTVLTIGTFDGLHRGHQALLQQLQTTASQQQAQTAVLTFHPRPKTVLAPHLGNNDYLTTSEERIRLFEHLGLDVLIITPFTLKFAQTNAHNFMKMITERINLVAFCAGHDFALGKDREGNLEKLAELGQEFGYVVCEAKPFLLDGQIISSTQIRQLLQTGDVRKAADLLGRYPAITGRVGTGVQRGRTIGFPTTNLIVPAERLIPTNGVYATFVQLESSQRLPGVTNVGIRPSFKNDVHTVETHIFDFDEDIYNQTLTLEFVERLRPEMKFDSIAALAAQISQDAKQAREILREPSI